MNNIIRCFENSNFKIRIQKRFYIDMKNLAYLTDLANQNKTTPSIILNAVLNLFKTKSIESELDLTVLLKLDKEL